MAVLKSTRLRLKNSGSVGAVREYLRTTREYYAQDAVKDGKETILPDVYENLYLNGNGKADFGNDYQPDIVSIALGTNDFSDGDGKKERLPFNHHKFIGNYIEFVQMIQKRYPQAQIVLLNSPMVNGEKNKLFVQYLNEVKDFFKNDTRHKPIQIFEFKEMTPKGCGYHPDDTDDEVMAEELYSFFKKLLYE